MAVDNSRKQKYEKSTRNDVTIAFDFVEIRERNNAY